MTRYYTKDTKNTDVGNDGVSPLDASAFATKSPEELAERRRKEVHRHPSTTATQHVYDFLED